MKRFLFILIVLPLLAAACGSSYSSGSSSTTSSSSSTTGSSASASKGVMNVAGKSSVAIQQHDYFFSPKVLKGTAGQKITVDLTNKGSVEHNFSVAGENVSVSVQPGKTGTAQVTFPKSGSVQFFCKFHKSLGMTGMLLAPGAAMNTSTSGGSTTTTNTTTNSGGSSTGYGY